MSRLAAIISAIVICLGCLPWVAGQSLPRQRHRVQKGSGTKRLSSSASAKDTIADMQTRQREVAALDAKYTKELADAKAENDALQRKLDNGGRVLVKGKCPVSASTQTAGAPSMGDDATVELSSVAGRNVLGIRAGIQRDQTALKTLQEYINTQCN